MTFPRLFTATLALMLAACVSDRNEQVSRGMLSALRRQSEDPGRLGFQMTGEEVNVQVNHRHGKQNFVQVPMRWRYGLPVIEAGMNGHRVLLIVDTGSQGTLVLDAATALRIRAATVDHALDRFHLEGTLGREPVILGSIRHTQIGTWSIDNLPCLIRTHQSMVGGALGRRALPLNIWGMAFLLQSCSYLTLDYPAERITFGFDSGYRPQAGRRNWQVPFRLRGGVPYITLEHAGVRWEALVDSGANGTLEISRATAQRTGLLNQAQAIVGQRLGVGTGSVGSRVAMLRANVPVLKGLGPALYDVPAYVVGESPKVGSAVLRQYRVTLDFRRKVMWLEERGKFR